MLTREEVQRCLAEAVALLRKAHEFVVDVETYNEVDAFLKERPTRGESGDE